MSGDDEPRPGNFDRAWNDPPLFSYKVEGTAPAGPKLNKRVMYPSGAPPSIPSSASPSGPRLHDAGAKVELASNLPPPPQVGSIGPPQIPRNDKKPSSTDKVSDHDRDETLNMLKTLLEEISSKIEARTHQDIKKRLDTLETKWKESTLGQPVERGLVNLTSCLMKSDFDEADKIQKKLMVDWPSNCGTWLVGIKHLIFNARNIAADLTSNT